MNIERRMKIRRHVTCAVANMHAVANELAAALHYFEEDHTERVEAEVKSKTQRKRPQPTRKKSRRH